jgi:hypothetical protein
MRHTFPKTIVVSALIGMGALGVARADCESDLIQLEQAYNTPKLTQAAKAALDDAKTKAVSALKKDDDASCHKAIAQALPKAGLTLK